MKMKIFLPIILLMSGCTGPRRTWYGEFCRPMCQRLFLPGWRECPRIGDRDYCTKELYLGQGCWESDPRPIP